MESKGGEEQEDSWQLLPRNDLPTRARWELVPSPNLGGSAHCPAQVLRQRWPRMSLPSHRQSQGLGGNKKQLPIGLRLPSGSCKPSSSRSSKDPGLPKLQFVADGHSGHGGGLWGEDISHCLVYLVVNPSPSCTSH